eukprot:2165259-Rhodomonas_salina.1
MRFTHDVPSAFWSIPATWIRKGPCGHGVQNRLNDSRVWREQIFTQLLTSKVVPSLVDVTPTEDKMVGGWKGGAEMDGYRKSEVAACSVDPVGPCKPHLKTAL